MGYILKLKKSILGGIQRLCVEAKNKKTILQNREAHIVCVHLQNIPFLHA